MHAHHDAKLSIFSQNAVKQPESTIRTATNTDLPALSDISKKTYIETYHDERFTDELLEKMFGVPALLGDFKNPEMTFILAFDNDKLCGYAKVQLQNDKIILDKIYLLQTYQRKGLGTQLLNHCFEHALQHQANKMELRVYCENKPAIEFYKKHGLTHTGTTSYHAANGVIVPDVIHIMTIDDIEARLKNTSRLSL